MSKRNLILLIIVLAIAIIIVFGFLYSRQAPDTTGDDTGGTNFISQFNPFGNSRPAPPKVMPPVDVSGYQPNPEPVANVKLKKVSSMPIAGFGVFMKERLIDTPSASGISPFAGGENTVVPPAKGGSGGVKKKLPPPPPTEFVPALRYVHRATGNIYQTFADKIAEQQFSGTVIPKVYDAYFGAKGEAVVMRYLKSDDRTIETFVGNLPKELLGVETNGSNEIKGSFLPENVKDVSISPDTAKVFYLFESADSIIGATLNLLNNKKIQVFDSPFTEWLSFWPNDKIITLTTKPSSSVSGYMYIIDPNSKNLNKILGDINGLTTFMSPNGKLVLYADNNLSLGVYHLDTRNSDLLGTRTLPEKCVWGKASDIVYCAVPKLINGGEYPDAWYQGEVSFSDQIWKIDIKNGNATMLSDPDTVTGGEDVDGIKLALDENENYLFFVNKKDSFLWELELK